MTHFPENFDVEFVGLEFHETTDPGRVVAEFRSVRRAVPAGKPYEQTCISIVYTDGAGRIIRYVDYWNPPIAIEALTPRAKRSSRRPRRELRRLTGGRAMSEPFPLLRMTIIDGRPCLQPEPA